MDDPLSSLELQSYWTSGPPDSKATVYELDPLPITWGGVVQEAPRYIRDIRLQADVVIQIVTTPKLNRGYIPRGAYDYLLSEIEDRGNNQDALLIFAGIYRTMEDADTWIAETAE